MAGTLALFAVGLVIMAAAVILLKFSIRRPRPEGEWGQIYRITDPHSFPSGHAARSATLAVMAIAWVPLVCHCRGAVGTLGWHCACGPGCALPLGRGCGLAGRRVMGLIAVAVHPLACNS
jgi:membrane-associated phospholipid phosphatase